MAANPKGPQKIKLDYNVDRQIYDEFVKAVSKKGYAPQIVVEKLMQKYSQTGQI